MNSVFCLAPYIIIRDCFHRNLNNHYFNSKLSANIYNQNNKSSIKDITDSMKISEKRSITHISDPKSISVKRRLL